MTAMEASSRKRTQSSGERLKHTTRLPQVFYITLFGFTRYLVEPAHRGRLQARFGRIIGRIDYLNLHFDRVLTALDPAFSLFTSIFHGTHSLKYTVPHGTNTNSGELTSDQSMSSRRSRQSRRRRSVAGSPRRDWRSS